MGTILLVEYELIDKSQQYTVYTDCVCITHDTSLIIHAS